MSTDLETARPLPLATTSTRGRHLLLELWGCDSASIGDVGSVERALLEATRALGASVLSSHLHRFAPQGVSGVVLIAESHLSIHTWPEAGYAAIDLYTCGPGEPALASDVLVAHFRASNVQSLSVERGRPAPEPSLRLVR